MGAYVCARACLIVNRYVYDDYREQLSQRKPAMRRRVMTLSAFIHRALYVLNKNTKHFSRNISAGLSV